MGTSAGKQRGGQKMGKMLPIKLILEISSAGPSQEGRLFVRSEGWQWDLGCDVTTQWLCPSAWAGTKLPLGRAVQHQPKRIELGKHSH